jgi:tetratricopeptide (TPR) repeat protein
MPRTDTAAVALRPLIDLTADARVAPSMLAEAALFSAAQVDPTGWLPWYRPGRELRPLLVRAGLVGPDDPLTGPQPVLQRVTRAMGADSDPLRLLWAARLYRQLGRYRQCAAVLRGITGEAPPEVLGWRDLLLAECGGAVAEPGDAAGLLGLAGDLARLTSAPSTDRYAVARARADQLPDEWQRTLARARILTIALASGGGGDPDGLCADLAGHRAAQPGDFLLREGELALRLAAAGDRLAAADTAGAHRHAQAVLALDPSGAAGHLLAARVALAADYGAEARRRYRSAARLGLAERHAALCGLADLAIASADRQEASGLPGIVADLLSHDPAPEDDRLQALASRAGPLAATIAADSVRWAQAARHAAPAPAAPGYPDPRAARALRRPLPLERYRAFIDLRPPADLDQRDWPPIAIHAPLMAHAAAAHRREPWFEEIHPQRGTGDLFRREMAHTASLYGYQSDAVGADYGRWLDAPDGCPPDVRELLLGAAHLPLLDRALLARLVCSVGFHLAARDMLPGPETPVRSPEGGYALATWLAAEQLRTAGRGAALDPSFRTLFAQLSDDPRNARTRVVATIDAAVNAAGRRESGTIAYWRSAGERALAQYVARPEVSDFSAALMTSRWYRAMSFLPLLTGDRDQLRSDLDQWLGIATDLAGDDDQTRIIAADNYFPAVETAIRAHVFLGDRDTALQLADKLAEQIDPIDPKTWLTAGELRYQAGDVAGARDAYLRAAHLQFPYGRLSWFNAGQCQEQLGDFQEAAECYRRSLAHWPTGVTPLRRLRDLYDAGHLGTDGPLLVAWAAGEPAWASVGDPAGAAASGPPG